MEVCSEPIFNKENSILCSTIQEHQLSNAVGIFFDSIIQKIMGTCHSKNFGKLFIILSLLTNDESIESKNFSFKFDRFIERIREKTVLFSF